MSATDQKRFLNIARGSLYEARTQLIIAHESNLLQADVGEELIDECEPLIKMVIVFTVRTKKRPT